MEEKVVQVREFVCKYCQKRCFNGKSLGGHMRRHLALISAAKDNNNNNNNKAKAETDMNCENGAGDLLGIEENNNNGCRSSSSSSSKVSAEQEETPKISLIQEKMDELMISVGIGSDDQDQDSYDLRENPKKSWKISDHVRAMVGDPIPKKVSYLCKECEKSFPSSRALSGHMRAHTVKGKKNGHICKKCSKGFESVRALSGHLKSHSKRPRFSSSSSTTTTKSEFDVDYPRKKRSVIRYNNLMTPTNTSLSTANASSSAAAAAFDFDDEVEDAAVCLMLLSRGTTDLVDSIDINEAVESKPFPLSQSESRSRGISADEEKNPPAKKTDSSSSLVSESDEINEIEKHNNDDDAKEAEIGLDLEPEMEKATKIAKASDSTQVEKVEPPPEKDLKSAALGTGTRRGSDEDDSEMLLHSDKNSVVVVVSEMVLKDDDGKKRGYKCRTCNMVFSSHQALGGHRNRHKVIMRSRSSGMVNGVLLSENNEYCYYYDNNNKYQNQNQKSKEHQHECAVCLKVFPTGQALGGHKRAHYAGFTESRTKENTTLVRNHQQEEEESTADDDDDDLTRLWWTTTEPGLVINQVTSCCSLL